MDKFKVGDLVMVVKPTTCCGSTKRVGLIFTIQDLYEKPALCLSCGARIDTMLRAQNSPKRSIELSRLIKIEPLNKESEHEQHELLQIREHA